MIIQLETTPTEIRLRCSHERRKFIQLTISIQHALASFQNLTDASLLSITLQTQILMKKAAYCIQIYKYLHPYQDNSYSIGEYSLMEDYWIILTYVIWLSFYEYLLLITTLCRLFIEPEDLRDTALPWRGGSEIKKIT